MHGMIHAASKMNAFYGLFAVSESPGKGTWAVD